MILKTAYTVGVADGFGRGANTIYFTGENVQMTIYITWGRKYIYTEYYHLDFDPVRFDPVINKIQLYNWSGKDHHHHHHQQRCSREKKACHQKQIQVDEEKDHSIDVLVSLHIFQSLS